MILHFLLLSYLIGSIPTGYLLAQFAGIADLRRHGSGTIGATNIGRVLGARYFALAFLIDASKAFLCLSFVQVVDSSSVPCAAVALVVGNIYSVFLQFQGGKGIATTIGVVLVHNPLVLCILAPVGLLLRVSGRCTMGMISSICMTLLPLVAWFLTSWAMWVSYCCIAVLCLWAHRAHIQKIFNAGV